MLFFYVAAILCSIEFVLTAMLYALCAMRFDWANFYGCPLAVSNQQILYYECITLELLFKF